MAVAAQSEKAALPLSRSKCGTEQASMEHVIGGNVAPAPMEDGTDHDTVCDESVVYSPREQDIRAHRFL